MDGSLAVDDIPAVWASKMKEVLEIDVPGDAEGCLQDIHWWVWPLSDWLNGQFHILLGRRIFSTSWGFTPI